MHQNRLRNLTFIAFATQLCGVTTLSAQPYAYVSNLAGNNVSVVNTSNYSVTTSVPVPPGPTGLAVTPDGSTVYVASQSASIVSAINTSSNSVVASISVGSTPTQLAISPNGAQVYVISQGSNQVYVIDTGSKSVVATIGVGSRPSAVAFSPDSSRAFVTNLWSSNVSLIDTGSRSVIKTFSADSGPTAVAVSGSGRVYISNQYSGSVTVHDLSGNLQTNIGGFAYPNSIAITPNGSRVYVTNGNSGSVSAIDTNTNSVIGTVGVGSLPSAVTISTDGSRAFVTNQYGLSLSVIDTGSNTVVNTIARVGIFPVGVAMVQGAVTSQPAPQPQPPPTPQCNYSLSGGSASYGAGSNNGSVNVAVAQGCGWSASGNPDWISITGGQSGNGAGTLSFSVAANGSTGGRSGSLTIAGQTFTITQSGMSCSYVLSAYSTSFGSGGGGGSVNINAPAGCAWNASSDSGWLAVTGGSSGNGPATVSFSASSNSNTSGRNGNLYIGGQTFTVTQGGNSFSPIRVNCGGPALTDTSGNAWAADDQRSRMISTAAIANTNNPALYQKQAWSNGTLQYQFNVPNGTFNVNLHFAELYATGGGQRTFDIVINGQTVAWGFDIAAQAGLNTATVQKFQTTATNGQVTIQLVPRTGNPALSGIEIY